MREECNKWIQKAGGNLTPKRRMKKPNITEVSNWVLNSWYGVKKEEIVKSFRKCGISNAMDGTEDDLIYIHSDSEDSSDTTEIEETDMFETTNSVEEESRGANRG